MKPHRILRLVFASFLLQVFFGWVLPLNAQVASEARIHPLIVLRDSAGANVLASGNPVSPEATCKECHDVDFITSHTIHDGAGLQTLLSPASTVSSRPWDETLPEAPEMNCFVCHTPNPANARRLEVIREGRSEMAPTATLEGASIVTLNGADWSWNPEAFDQSGFVLDSLLAIQAPKTVNCALCHGVAGDEMDSPVTIAGLDASDWQTVSRGEIISPQRISDSGVNVMGKDSLHRSWDVHSERLLECTNCHYSVNNPVYRRESEATQPAGLIFDSRRMPLGAYLQRPSHNFSGQSDQNGHTLTSDPLSCTTCHDPAPTHQWLPYSKRHMDALACEVCHSPVLYSVAMESVDWTALTRAEEPDVNWRGCEAGCETGAADLVRGVEPTLLPRRDPDGEVRLAPYNLVSSWFWVGGETARPVDLNVVAEAASAASDPQDRDEVAERLRALGVADPRIAGEIMPYPIHHGVADGEWATRDCQSCHDEASRLSSSTLLAESAPGGVIPELVSETDVSMAGSVLQDGEGSLFYHPHPRAGGFYVLGHDSARWAHILGILALVLTLVAVSAHGTLRWLAARKEPAGGASAAAPPVYMYTTYERVWHWLQALAILLLMVTGIEIHVTRTGVLDFAFAVRAHNVLGFVVLANAVFAAFFHLASGEIQQYLPRPQGFFGQAIVQARFYLSGIFKGDGHPFEKSPDRKLNPLQQVTYLVILNVLLPLQMVTGIFIWGAQQWPAVDRVFGGLPVLAPIHTLGAWLFAAFLLMHVYLTTTGPTPTANLQAMLLGWEGGEALEGTKEAT
ncbi:MAG: cytochrome b/b6 domain-containing protein [Gemmatimonadota bacterium]|jgi:thiosulfate reductase cytochrome b subunit